MKDKKYDFLVYIGRFEPLTIPHMKIIMEAKKLAKKVLLLVGSSGEPRSFDNPFSFEERKDMITMTFSEDVSEGNILIKPIYDFPYNDRKWLNRVQETVKSVVGENSYVGIIGCDKDVSSFYLKLFPKWANVQVEIETDGFNDVINATDVRNAFFKGTATYGALAEKVKLKIYDYVDNFFNSDDSNWLKEEYKFIVDYKGQWEDLIYQNPEIKVPEYIKNPVFVTGDSVVVQSGHILLVKRKHCPGKGLWALPGGFINPNERIRNGIIRELREETCLKVPEDVLIRNIKHVHVFDNPKRSKRGRIITHAAYIDLGDYENLPHIKGADDAEKAQWVALSDVKRENMFEDHYAIIDFFLNIA